MVPVDEKAWWSLLQESMQAFSPFYREAMQNAIKEAGVPERWFALLLARGADPAPLSIDRIQELSPYTAREQFVEHLEEHVRLDLLERVGTDAYRIIGPGQVAVEGIFQAAHESMAPLEPLEAWEMEALNDLLYRLVEATLTAPEPEDKWSIAYSRWTDPGEGAPLAVTTDQFLTDLLRFRDDAHLAAWRPYGVSGHAWEALTFIWQDEAHTAEELVEKLLFRSYTVEDYAGALQGLAALGWVAEEEGAYQLTAEGKRVRDEAEASTDRLYFGPWSCLEDKEQERLHDLLTRLRANLHEMAEDQ